MRGEVEFMKAITSVRARFATKTRLWPRPQKEKKPTWKLEFNNSKEERSSSGRRDLVFAAAAFSVAKVALADEPKKGTPEF
ncbi:hypothetical protein CFP56_037204 [Quercus suber]|uniref:Uncharacterized protein n=1 Tax=Quercus suber TaxID=58331 RepID=A0AAW0J610_QUESU